MLVYNLLQYIYLQVEKLLLGTVYILFLSKQLILLKIILTSSVKIYRLQVIDFIMLQDR